MLKGGGKHKHRLSANDLPGVRMYFLAVAWKTKTPEREQQSKRNEQVRGNADLHRRRYRDTGALQFTYPPMVTWHQLRAPQEHIYSLVLTQTLADPAQ